jgi:hypothetical protein
MKQILSTFFLFFILSNCSNTKTVLICGDHVCINKAEAEQYFEENLSIEVKVINKKVKKDIDLIELNLSKDLKGDRKISYVSKKSLKDNLKTLSDDEIKKIKKKINNKKKEEKVVKKIINKNQETTINKNLKTKNIKQKTNIIRNGNVNKQNKKNVDVCTILEKCSIDEISKFLLEQGNKKGFPDITKRQ